jgi:hypothetical protein
LELLHHLYNSLYHQQHNTPNQQQQQQVEQLFDYLDQQGNIHLRLSTLFFLSIAFHLQHHLPLANNYEQHKPHFQNSNQLLCEINGLVSLRWFKNYFLMKNHQEEAKPMSDILKEIERVIKGRGERSKKGVNGLPNIM